jgi:GH15 family glucan-1,4-alpha-glucosidase
VPSRIEDYALLGDCETAALVSRNGSIDWLCWPRFDSGACFAALLGTPDHGCWRLAPRDAQARSTRRYRGDTLILDTEFTSGDGAVTVTDFMPHRGPMADLVRIVRGRRGHVAMRSEILLRFNYGSSIPWVTRMDEHAVRAIAGPDMVMIRSSVPLRGEGFATVSDFSVGEDEVACFAMTYGPSHRPPPPSVDAQKALADTEAFWNAWAARSSYHGDARDAVIRSLVTLKALTYAPTGGIVAAPTTSLPEHPGGARNWDYRYCWLRDATLTLLSLMDAGYFDEAVAWRDWLLRAVAGNPADLQIMYGLAGERHLMEWEVRWLPGYESSRPVRIGNDAYSQLQIDVFGEVLDALHQARLHGLTGDDGWNLQKSLVNYLESVWDAPDRGIWEVRGPNQHFTHSKVMAWVALDRAIKTAEHLSLSGPLDRWRSLRARIHREVCEHGFDTSMNSFVQAYGTTQLDASLLQIPLVGFLSPTDPRVHGTVEAIQRRLVADGLVYRYDSQLTDDGLPPGEGAFIACSFWLADNLALIGRRDEARDLFEQLVSLANDVGLLAEEYDPRAKRMLGNFPQAFSHVALVAAADSLATGGTARSVSRGRREG